MYFSHFILISIHISIIFFYDPDSNNPDKGHIELINSDNKDCINDYDLQMSHLKFYSSE